MSHMNFAVWPRVSTMPGAFVERREEGKKGGRAVYQADPWSSQFSFSSLRTKVHDKVANSL